MSCLPAFSFERIRRADSAGYRISLTRVLFPLPETPVTATNLESGISTSIFLRLCCLAPLIIMLLPLPLRLFAGTGINFSPERYLPVIELLQPAISLAIPLNTILPP